MPTETTVRIWDPIVRISHWLVAACVLANLAVLESGSAPHRWAGYIACGTVALRTLWGFLGTEHARFTTWFPIPSRLLPYLALLVRGKAPRMLGHNPAGALMMLALWCLVLALGTTGYLLGTDAYFGEEWLEELHEGIANALIVAVSLHILAALIESWRHRENLPLAMLTGRKRPLAESESNH